ncbi:DUF4238 domain-containing protein [Halococcus sp. PRR34]|uniref:DUF4238 domain-containing protein n=1 Tax=Halococcus sp. PRR34 TaxID=3020830 RepID=UPI0023615B32|nr:DUF4238 domain-containing protein [Halococcus sp. PRR34]
MGCISIISHSRCFKTSISNVAAEDFFYDGKTKLVPEVENFLEKLEQKVGAPYKKIINKENLHCLTTNEKGVLAYFLGVQSIRTRGERSSIKGMIQAIENEIPRENMSNDFKKEIDDMKQDESLRKVQNSLIKDGAKDFARMLLDLEWHLFINATDLPYYTSDYPVAKHNEFNLGPYGDLGLRSRGVQIYFPLNPWMMLSIIEPSMYPNLPEVSKRADRENIVFQRDLQVQRSNRFVYSHMNDFDQAERRVKSTPQVAKPLSDRVSVQ